MNKLLIRPLAALIALMLIGTGDVYGLKALNDLDLAPGGFNLEDRTIPIAAPSDLKGFGSAGGAFDITWTDNSTNEAGFNVEADSGSGFVVMLTVLADHHSASFALPEGTKSTIRVCAVRSGIGANSGYSNAVDFFVLSKPTVKPVDSGGAVNLICTVDPAEGLNYFVIVKSIQGSAEPATRISLTPGQFAIDDKDVSLGKTYIYQCEAYSKSDDQRTISDPVSIQLATPSSVQQQPKPQETVTPQSTVETQKQTVQAPAIQTESTVSVASASSWAQPELELAQKYQLTTKRVMNDYTGSITREEFCGIAVKLYEATSGKKALPSINNPFVDTSDPDTLKAIELGIVKGVSADRFAPNNNITRQEICVMIYRALKVAKGNLDTNVSGVGAFGDESAISDWAKDAVRYASKHGIIKGTGVNTVNPLSNTTREQGIIMIKRTYEAFK